MTGAIGSLACVCIAAACLGVDEGLEPPLKYTLRIDGKTHEIKLGAPLRLEGAYENPKLVLAVSATRNFQYAGLGFRYPAAFGWEAEIEGPNEKTWTLSGNDIKIMYFVLPETVEPASYVACLAEGFGDDKANISDISRKLGAP